MYPNNILAKILPAESLAFNRIWGIHCKATNLSVSQSVQKNYLIFLNFLSNPLIFCANNKFYLRYIPKILYQVSRKESMLENKPACFTVKRQFLNKTRGLNDFIAFLVQNFNFKK